MKIAFRVDSSKDIGTGHVMRCLTLANGLIAQCKSIRFVAAQMPLHLQEIILSKGFELKLLAAGDSHDFAEGTPHAKWLKTSQEVDALETIDALDDEVWDLLIVDHYALDARWESILRENSKLILVIDDLADRQHNCDILIDQNFYLDLESRYQDKVPLHCQLLLGPKYALLRSEFRRLRETLKPRLGNVNRILVFFGGIDLNNYTGVAIAALSKIQGYTFDVDVVIGFGHPSKQEILEQCKTHGYTCYVQTNDMAQVMANADLVIGAGGAATWEKFCLGLPSIAFATAENQIKQLNDLAIKGYCYTVQDNQETARALEMHIKAMLNNPNLMTFFANNGASLIDGLGVQRVVKAVISKSLLKLRQAAISDEKNIYEWRNHPAIRSVSVDSHPIQWEQHQRWYQRMLENSNQVMLIAELNQLPVGVVRFDIENKQAEVSIYLVQQEVSKGLGYSILTKAEQWLLMNGFNIKQFSANVLEGNSASHSLFARAGYSVEVSNYRKVVH